MHKSSIAIPSDYSRGRCRNTVKNYNSLTTCSYAVNGTTVGWCFGDLTAGKNQMIQYVESLMLCQFKMNKSFTTKYLFDTLHVEMSENKLNYCFLVQTVFVIEIFLYAKFYKYSFKLCGPD